MMEERKEKNLLGTETRADSPPSSALESESKVDNANLGLRKSIGANIREWRRKTSVSQSLLAKRASLTQAQLSDIENGKASLPGLNSLVNLAGGMGVSPGSLLNAVDLDIRNILIPSEVKGEYLNFIIIGSDPDDNLFAAPEISYKAHTISKAGKVFGTAIYGKYDKSRIVVLERSKIVRAPSGTNIYTSQPSKSFI